MWKCRHFADIFFYFQQSVEWECYKYADDVCIYQRGCKFWTVITIGILEVIEKLAETEYFYEVRLVCK
jgi:hypothetical protein